MTALSDLKTDQWLSFFQNLKDLNVLDVSLTGGEPFTRADLFELIDGIISNNMRYNILSNGTLITEKTLKKFEKGKRKIRLDLIQISIDGSKSEIHDKSRPNSFERAIKALRLLKKSGYPVVVRTTINRHNLYDLENIAYLLLEDIGLKSFSTNDAMPIGSGCRNEESVSLNSRETLEAMKIIDRLLKRYPGRITAQAGPLAKIKMYTEMEHAKKTGETTNRWKMGYLTACGCVFSKIDILHDGTVVPCCMLPGLNIGNILTDSLKEIWQNHPVMWELRERLKIPMNTVSGCEDCEWNLFCNGNCPGLAHQLTGILTVQIRRIVTGNSRKKPGESMPCETEKEPKKTKRKKLDLPEGIPPLTSLYLYIAGSCNLACKHCWISPDFQQNPENGKFVKPEYVKNAIIQAIPLGLSSIKLTGGEPLLHPGFKEIAEIIENEKIYFHMETNGILIDKDMAEFLKKRKKTPFIAVSVDGAYAKTHDDLRGVMGSFDQAIEGIKNLVDSGFKPQVICTLHKGNVSEMEQLLKLAKKLGCGSVKFNHVQEVGRGDSYNKENGLEITEIIKLFDLVEKKLIPENKMHILFDIPFAFYPVKRLLRERSRCNVLNILGMLSGGELSLCGIGTTVPELIYGHMKNNNLKEVWCESPGLHLLRELVPEKLEGICSNCIHRDFCLGSCGANTYYRTKKLNAPYVFCEQAEKLKIFPDSRKKLDKKKSIP